MILKNQKRIIEIILNSELTNDQKLELAKCILQGEDTVKKCLLTLNISVEILKLFDIIE